MGCNPVVFITDQCPAMKVSVPASFCGENDLVASKHRLCMWHIMQKFQMLLILLRRFIWQLWQVNSRLKRSPFLHQMFPGTRETISSGLSVIDINQWQKQIKEFEDVNNARQPLMTRELVQRKRREEKLQFRISCIYDFNFHFQKTMCSCLYKMFSTFQFYIF